MGATPATQHTGGCRQVPRLPRNMPRGTKVDVTKRHAYHAKTNCDQARHQSQPGAISATPAMQNKGGCPQVPHLGAKCAQARHQIQPSAASAMTAMQNEGRCHQVPRLLSPSARPATRNEVGCHQVPCLPRKAKVDVAKCHACHAKYRGGTGDQVHPRAPKCATRASPVPPATRDDGGCHQVPGLPAKRAKCAQARHQIQPSAAVP